MQALTEFAPLVAFVVAYFLGGLYAATAVLMVAMLVLLGLDWLRLKRIPPMHAVSAVLVLIFGGATLALHDKTFIQWKPTVFFWLVSLAFVGSFWIGERTLTERLLGGTLAQGFGEQVRVSAALWRRLNLLWAVFYALLGALNIVVLRYLSERAWVALKLVDFVAMVLFLLAQVLWLAARAAPAAPQALESGDGRRE
ncbi:MAG TPA: inner membrane-spanning protein YciB [Steroidobacteraceae bacterium]|nr:inner membrane-spanning protein YciB [Steroidobacteraceae bacterium]